MQLAVSINVSLWLVCYTQWFCAQQPLLYLSDTDPHTHTVFQCVCSFHLVIGTPFNCTFFYGYLLDCICRWFEQDAEELLGSVRECVEEVGRRLGEGGVRRLAGVGITNQRETTILWDKTTGKPLHSAIGTHVLSHSTVFPMV